MLESAWADDRNEWRPVVRVVYYGVFEVLRMTLLAGDEGDLHKREWPKWFCVRLRAPLISINPAGEAVVSLFIVLRRGLHRSAGRSGIIWSL